jgi:luciferase family oxidoreductase group 1
LSQKNRIKPAASDKPRPGIPCGIIHANGFGRESYDDTVHPRSRPRTEDTDARGALDNARDVAVHAEAWGYRRIWVAEHHNMPGIASAATSVVIGHIAAGTKTIRVGAGGIMLPNHAPYVIAEQFGTLARLFPGRIDLGLGRARN